MSVGSRHQCSEGQNHRSRPVTNGGIKYEGITQVITYRYSMLFFSLLIAIPLSGYSYFGEKVKKNHIHIGQS